MGGPDPLRLLFLLPEADQDGDAERGGEELRDDADGRDDVAGLGAGDDAEDEGGEEAGGGDAAEGSLVGHLEGVEGAVEAGVWDGGREEKEMRPSRGLERVVDFGSPPVIVASGLFGRRKLGSLIFIPTLMRYGGEVNNRGPLFDAWAGGEPRILYA